MVFVPIFRTEAIASWRLMPLLFAYSMIADLYLSMTVASSNCNKVEDETTS